jgi:hypothetical protein
LASAILAYGDAARCADRFDQQNPIRGDETMSKELINRQPNFGDDNYDDGFSDSPLSRVIRNYLRWTEQTHWTDRDGIPPPSPMLVTGISEAVRRWRTVDGIKKPEDITAKPLPDPEELNRTTPQSEWERQLDGKMSAGWAHTVFVYLVNLATGARYTFSSNTAGAHIAWDLLREDVMTMRALRGQNCFPVVDLTERPMKSAFRPNGWGMRPHFEPIDWKIPGAPDVVTERSKPQLTGPASTPATNPTSAAHSAAPAAARAPTPHPVSAPASKPPSAKTPVKLSDYTLAVMGEVKPVTTEELLNDSLDDMPWDSDPPQ